jgi:adenylyltransferase/sulfurtransferase
MKTIEVGELKQRLESGETFLLLDVRQPEETEYGMLPGAKLFPMPEVPQRIAELKDLVKSAEQTVVYCRSGGRSENVALFLESEGFPELFNLVGGTNAWSQLDSSIKAY